MLAAGITILMTRFFPDDKLRLNSRRHLAGDGEGHAQQQPAAGAGGAHVRRGRVPVRAGQRADGKR